MKLLLIRTLTGFGLSIFNFGCDLADKWGLDDKLWVEINDDWNNDDEDDPENPLNDVWDMDPDPIAKEKI